MVIEKSEGRMGLYDLGFWPLRFMLILICLTVGTLLLQPITAQTQPQRPNGAQPAETQIGRQIGNELPNRRAFRQACQRIKCANGTRCALYRGKVACVRQDRKSQTRKRANPMAVTRSERLEFFRPTGTRAKPCPDGAVYLKNRGVCVRQIAPKPATSVQSGRDALVKRQRTKQGADASELDARTCRSGYAWDGEKRRCFLDKTAVMARHCERLGKILVGETCR